MATIKIIYARVRRQCRWIKVGKEPFELTACGGVQFCPHYSQKYWLYMYTGTLDQKQTSIADGYTFTFSCTQIKAKMSINIVEPDEMTNSY